MRDYQNWFQDFIDECCIIDDKVVEKSIDLYRTYINFSYLNNLYIHSTLDFYKKMSESKFKRLTIKRIKYFKGIKLKDHKYLNFKY